jgi:hypothetical protein
VPSLLTSYSPDLPPELILQLSSETGNALVLAVVDSGADRTLFPAEIAELLGLSEENGGLVQDEHGGRGVGGVEFPTWFSTREIIGQVMQIAEEDELIPWGPSFGMDPAFTGLSDGDDGPDGTFLLGRNDFFQAFAITFGWEEDGPAFELAY